jgi:N-acetyl-anhydromuramyl-L-alanine amidase AmpD
MAALDLSTIRQHPLKDGQFFNETSIKKQIVLHHTAGNASGVNTISAWNADSRGRIATFVCISGKNCVNSRDGEIVQCFSSKNWAYHLGVKAEVFASRGVKWQNLDKLSIGIEICNWGPLEHKNGKFYNYVDREVPADEVCTLDKPFKGFKHYHAYSDAQIESTRKLVIYLHEKYGIDITYNEDIWNVTDRALKGENGLFTHNSYRKDKSDIYPHPKMVEMLKGLK